MILCIAILAAAARLAGIADTQFHKAILQEMLSGLLTTIYHLQAYT